MCTVSYIPSSNGNDFILTSNRDEKVKRPTFQPDIYNIRGTQVCFPKDALAGGSWIAASDKGRLCCLLNGAFAPHEKQSFHTHSRGKVLTDLVASPLDVMVYFSQEDLSKTEPFTIITLEMNGEKLIRFTEFIWDGTTKNLKDLDQGQPYVWSSVTLYSDEHRRLRSEWFHSFLSDHHSKVSSKMVWNFHSGNHTNDHTVNLVMHRDEGLKTVSITQVTPRNGKFAMKYIDLLESAEHIIQI
jgi:transport and Golgi organization protein 2